jgi:hypothetical protein
VNDETQFIGKENNTSRVLNVSLRGWIATMVVFTVCLMSVLALDVKEPLYTLAGLVVGFYFGQNKPKQ